MFCSWRPSHEELVLLHVKVVGLLKLLELTLQLQIAQHGVFVVRGIVNNPVAELGHDGTDELAKNQQDCNCNSTFHGSLLKVRRHLVLRVVGNE